MPDDSREVTISFPARGYQRPLIDYFRGGGKSAFCVWHRKSGKDRTATFIESERMFERVGLYWHALPKYEDARRVIWDAITIEGKKLIDVNFPREIVKKKLDHDMKIETVNGSIWQPIGADNFDSLVGAFPVHVTYSEFALMDPRARGYIRPAIAMSGGTELFIGTPRGYNHAHDLWQYAKANKDWYTSLLTVDETGIFSGEFLAQELKQYQAIYGVHDGEALFRQEYYCAWEAANVGSILGRYVESAEREGRITDELDYDPEGAPLEISSDIGRRHISAWWFWQPLIGGFNLIDYDEDTGLDAQEWIERLKKRIGTRKLGRIWLPHDARAKTFSAQHSAVEQFLTGFGHDKVRISPETRKAHSIDAARSVFRYCRFHRTRCARGLAAMRAWSYHFDEERKQFSKDPVQDWSTDASEAFCEGAKVLRERVAEPVPPAPGHVLGVGEVSTYTMEDAWRDHERLSGRRARI